jgi:hypothetical protein
LLLAKDNEEETAWHLAANKSNSAVLEKLYVCANKAKMNLKINLFFFFFFFFKIKDVNPPLLRVEGNEYVRQ